MTITEIINCWIFASLTATSFAGPALARNDTIGVLLMGDDNMYEDAAMTSRVTLEKTVQSRRTLVDTSSPESIDIKHSSSTLRTQTQCYYPTCAVKWKTVPIFSGVIMTCLTIHVRCLQNYKAKCGILTSKLYTSVFKYK